MKHVLLLTFMLSALLLSCSNYKTIQGVTITPTDGKQRVSIPKDDILITYYGDYWFHPLNKKQTLNWSDEIVELLNENRKRKLLYATHTITDPYCSSIGILYQDSAINKFVQKEQSILREKYKARNLKQEEIKFIGTKRFIKLTYNLPDKNLRVSRKCVDYFTKCNGDILRIVFWTMDDNDEWLRDETDGIVRSIISGL